MAATDYPVEKMLAENAAATRQQERQPEVLDAMQALGYDLNGLDKLVNTLAGRLSPALRYPAEETGTSRLRDQRGCALAELVEEHRTSVWNLSAIVQDLLDRLEV